MTIYEIQNAQKTPIWKQRIIECRSSGKSVKEWCKEHDLDFTTYYRWERKILAHIIPAEEYPVACSYVTGIPDVHARLHLKISAPQFSCNAYSMGLVSYC